MKQQFFISLFIIFLSFNFAKSSDIDFNIYHTTDVN